MNVKQLIKLMLLSLLIILNSCRGDDEDPNVNTVNFKSGSFKLYKGIQFKYSEASKPELGTPFRVILLGEGVTFDQTTSKPAGIGSIISFYMYSESTSEIKQGEYTIDIFSLKPKFSADSCIIRYNYDFSQDTGKVYKVNAGIFNVSNLGSVMSYEIDVVSDTILFTGDFKGPIQTLK